MKYAIVESGGKQYKAVEGGTIEVDRLNKEAGEDHVLENVLLVSDEGNVVVGTPTISGAKVSTMVVKEFKGPKIIIYKYKPSKRYRLKKGHRQWYTRLQIESIDGVKAAKKTAAKPAEAEKAEDPAEKAAPSTRKKLSSFELNKRSVDAYEAAGISTVSQFLKKLAEGEDAVLAIDGIGPKSLEDTKKVLEEAGYDLP